MLNLSALINNTAPGFQTILHLDFKYMKQQVKYSVVKNICQMALPRIWVLVKLGDKQAALSLLFKPYSSVRCLIVFQNDIGHSECIALG